MQVVVLAAGRGERFSNGGYVLPKPLIPVRGKAMVQYALEASARLTQTPIVVCPANLKFNIWAMAQQTCTPTMIGVKYTQSGAAMSLLAAAAALDEERPVLVTDCDSIIDPAIIETFAAFSVDAFSKEVSSTVLTFKPTDDSARYSFARYNGMRVTNIVEKCRVSDMATCGVHCFRTWSTLRLAIAASMLRGEAVNAEFYLAPVHNNVAETRLYEIPEKEFHIVGTPEQLAAYEESIGTTHE